MKTRFKIALTVLLVIILCVLAQGVFVLLNLANTVAVLIGAVLGLSMFVLIPVLFVRIWRKKSHDSQEKPIA